MSDYALNVVQMREAVALYGDGMSMCRLAAAFGVSITAIRNALRLCGVNLRSRADACKPRPISIEAIKLNCLVDPRTECWEWQGSVQSNGYGRVRFNGRTQYVHRVVLSLSTGKPLDSKLACHTCDNRMCCNPEHIYAGTSKTNARDASERGRHSSGVLHGIKVARALRARNTKLSMEKAREIRRRAAAGEKQEQLAIAFGVDRSSVGLVVNQKTWREYSALP